MKTFMELYRDWISDCRAKPGVLITSLPAFAYWLDQRYAPAALPGGAQPEAHRPSSSSNADDAGAASTAPAADNGGRVPFSPTSDQMELLIWAVDEAEGSIGGKDPADMEHYEVMVKELRGILAAFALINQSYVRPPHSIIREGLKALLDSCL